jgi:hypothetical protein
MRTDLFITREIELKRIARALIYLSKIRADADAISRRAFPAVLTRLARLFHSLHLRFRHGYIAKLYRGSLVPTRTRFVIRASLDLLLSLRRIAWV